MMVVVPILRSSSAEYFKSEPSTSGFMLSSDLGWAWTPAMECNNRVTSV
jgi:hypothetical protein